MSPLEYFWQQVKIPYHFENPNLLRQALTHRSHSSEHNERLEFLGDALLETIISAELFTRFPEDSEGDLSRIRASVVNREALAAIARKLNLGNYLRLGPGERKSGGQRRDSTLANAIEALIAAVYLDSDFERCRSFTLEIFAETLASLRSAEELKDPKTRLQEFLQGRGYDLPQYSITQEYGPEHARQFEITAVIGEKAVTAVASSRKKAEQQAAQALLIWAQETL